MDFKGKNVGIVVASFILGVATTLGFLQTRAYNNNGGNKISLQNLSFGIVNMIIFSEPDRGRRYEELKGVLGRAANKDNTVILTQVNEAFAKPGSLLDLFLESFRAREDIEHLLSHLVLITVDQSAYERCQSLRQHCYFLRTEGGADYSDEKVFMSKDYFDMMWGRNRFQLTILELGFNFLFTDVDILWFRDPFRHIAQAADLAVACDEFRGDPYSLDNVANGGFIYAKSSNKTIEFYRFWHESRERFPGRHEQDVLNMINSDVIPRMKLQLQFLDTAYMGTFCQLSHDVHRICTLHSNCCVGLGNKTHDLTSALQDWKAFTGMPTGESPPAPGDFRWSAPSKCSLDF